MTDLENEFEKIWATKPFHDNIGGLNFYGMFSLWKILKNIQPRYIIESGVWKGASTWLIDQIERTEKIVCMDPLIKYWHPHNLIYTSKKAVYTTTDFLDYNFTDIDFFDTLIFFDDHQDVLPRILKCRELGIKNIVLDDNYKSDLGSHNTLYCYQHLINDNRFKEITIKQEINFNVFDINDKIDESCYREAANNNLTYIEIEI